MTSLIHPPGRLVDVGGHRLWVERLGHGEPLLLLSGGPASSHALLHVGLPALADRFELLFVDLRGRGQSDRPRSWDEVTFVGDVADVEALRRALGVERWSVYGFSYGGMVAAAHALAHPASVRRLVLANTVHSPEMWQRNHENINRELANQYPEVWDRILEARASGARSTSPEVQELYRVHSALVRFRDPDKIALLPTEPGLRNPELYRVFAGDDIEFFLGGEVARLPDLRPRLRELVPPTMVLAGRWDRALYPAMQREFVRWAPQVRFEMLERSGSFGHVEEPERVVQLVREHLAA